jgi:hypothetical protein
VDETHQCGIEKPWRIDHPPRTPARHPARLQSRRLPWRFDHLPRTAGLRAGQGYRASHPTPSSVRLLIASSSTLPNHRDHPAKSPCLVQPVVVKPQIRCERDYPILAYQYTIHRRAGGVGRSRLRDHAFIRGGLKGGLTLNDGYDCEEKRACHADTRSRITLSAMGHLLLS